MLKIIILFILLALYAHLYLHFIVNPNNECTILQDINKEDITNSVYVKQPFIFDASSLRRDLTLNEKEKREENKKEKEKENSIEKYDVSYVPIPILEPYVRFWVKRTHLHLSKKKKWLDTNQSCRTFYRFHKGTFDVCCIHPKYKEFVSNKQQLKEHPKMIRLTLHEDSILSLPCYWYVHIIPLSKDSIVDKIQYFTPLNHCAIAISKITQ